MRTIHPRIDITPGALAHAFGPIAGFTRFPGLAEDARAVGRQTDESLRHSDGEVDCRQGIVWWTETEAVDPERLRITFDQTDGDFEAFLGSWQHIPTTEGADVCFEVIYGCGIESLAGITEPIAERAVCSPLAGLSQRISVREGGEALCDPTGPGSRSATDLGGVN